MSRSEPGATSVFRQSIKSLAGIGVHLYGHGYIPLNCTLRAAAAASRIILSCP